MKFCLVLLSLAFSSLASANTVSFRSFSTSAAIGPPADAYADKLRRVTVATLGPSGELHLVKLPGTPPVPAVFQGDVIAAVAAGEAGGGYDAAYVSGSDLSRTWGFLFNSGVPFGPSFDEFVGFLYGPGLGLVQRAMDKRDVIVIPIVGSPEQLSGYFPEPMSDVRGRHGIGLTGLCQSKWVLRYLPPGENVINEACDGLVGPRKKTVTFVQSIPGGGSLVDAVAHGTLNGFEFATPLDDVSQLFVGTSNPGTVGVRFVHTPGWQQPFLVTWMVINKQVWASWSTAQQLLAQVVARDHLVSSYADNVRVQGDAFQVILDANNKDGNPGNDMVLVPWPAKDLARLRDATIRVLNARSLDTSFPAGDRADYGKMLETLRLYVRANDRYWNVRRVDASLRFVDWVSASGDRWVVP